jgi:hypothetical protein
MNMDMNMEAEFTYGDLLGDNSDITLEYYSEYDNGNDDGDNGDDDGDNADNADVDECAEMNDECEFMDDHESDESLDVATATMDVKKVNKIPKKIFIVPYRNRPQHKFFFSKHMSFILEDEMDNCEIYFSHQCDGRTFNRGAAKNIGFMAVRNKYPDHYKQMTFIFNDVDTIPFHKVFDYDTVPGVVKHYYGYEYALGGIVVMKGSDFERINGFPCYWGWGMEDNALQRRCMHYGLQIDRSHFYKIGSPEILQLFDGISRIISKKDPYRMKSDNGVDGIRTIKALQYDINKESDNPNDNVYVIENEFPFYVINIKTFLTFERFEDNKYYNYDLRQPAREIIHPHKLRETPGRVVTTDDWSNIPYYPTSKENRENIAKFLIASGKRVPESLIHQINQDRKKELVGDIYNSTAPHPNHSPPPQHMPKGWNTPPQPHHQPQHQPQSRPIYAAAPPPPPPHLRGNSHSISPATLYSPHYAKSIGTRERATKSANIGLGGILRR